MPHVLFADDDQELLSILVERFQKAGWQAESVVGGNVAFAKVEAGGIDLVVSDLRMPNGTGIELLRKLRRKRNDGESVPPIIMMTGMIEIGESYLKALGAYDIFLKSLKTDVLLKLAEEAIKSSQKK